MLIYLPFVLLVSGVLFILYLEFFEIHLRVRDNPANESDIKKRITKKYLLGLSRSSFLSLIVSISTAVIALNAVQISVSEGKATRFHNQLTVKPNVTISYFANNQGAGFALNSNGLGPAVVKWTEVLVDSSSLLSWADVDSTLILPKHGLNGTYLNTYPGIVLRPGDVGILYSVKEKEDVDFLNKNYGRVKINMCYCSVYSEVDAKQCWQTSNFFSDISPTCKDEPEVVFPKK